ncbi:MAG: fused MFS/spermidine synthase, partial [Candidatus Acidiferrales bacterium]
MSSLIFEIVFTRLLTYTFGNTAQAASTVLAAFLGGLAVGAFFLGRWIDYRPPSLWVYGSLELLVGLYCLLIPKLFALLTWGYVALYHRLQLGPASLTAVRFGLASLVILPPTFLLGGTLPVLARYTAARESDFESKVARLYGWNTLGAAAGALGSTYLLVPFLGIRGAIWIACGINFAIFASIALLPATRTSVASSKMEAAPAASANAATSLRKNSAVLLLGAFLTGAIALTYEVLWTHIQVFTIGNTVYAFGVMLFVILCGLGWAAQIVAQRLRHPKHWGAALAGSQLLLGLAIFLTLPFWNRLAYVFDRGLNGAFVIDILSLAFLLVLRIAYLAWRSRQRPRPARSSALRRNEALIESLFFILLVIAAATVLGKYETTRFVAGELLRFFCAFYLLIIPALLLGISFPLLINLSSHSVKRVGTSVGHVYAANTAGAILGSVLGGFVLVPQFGSQGTLRGLAAFNLALALLFAVLLVRLTGTQKLALAGAALALALALWAGSGDWDARRMTRGSYVYFGGTIPIDRVLYLREDVQGGLTAVVQDGAKRTLLSNGKFQGDNRDEIQAQSRFALIPALFSRNFDRALVIGLGTGSTLRTLSLFPFQHIDAVEIAPHIVEAARMWFEDVNGRVFDRDARVKLSIADGRNFLLLSRQPYDLITIEITSIWISGEADLYNREFYELCRARLTDSGVLQQWVQIHHLRTEDLLVLLNTAARVFPHVAFFVGPEHGVLLASAAPLECDYAQIERFDADAGIRRELDLLHVPSMASFLGEMMLYEESARQAIALLPRLSRHPADFVSSDFRPFL